MFNRFDNTMSVGIGYGDNQKCCYFFDEHGIYQKNGWYQDTDGDWCYAGSDGKLLEGWQYINGVLYYFKSNGEQSLGIENVGGQYYFFQPNM